MKNKILNILKLIVVLILSFGLTGCNDKKQTDAKEESKESLINKENLVTEVGDLDLKFEPFFTYYHGTNSFSEGLAAVLIDWKYCYIDKKGQVVISTDYDDINSFSCGIACVKKDDKYAYIDKSGNIVIDFEEDNTERRYEDDLLCTQNETYLDTNGNVVIDDNFEMAQPFSEGLACVKKDGKYGYIDKKGNVVIDLKYDTAYDFSEGLALVGKDDQYSYINYNEEAIIGKID